MRKIVEIGLTACLMLGLSGCDNKEEKVHSFLAKVDFVHNEMKKSALVSPDLKVNINDLPKTIILEDKSYDLDYSDKNLIVKNFNNSFYCNKEFSATTTNRRELYALGSVEIFTKCENNNMSIYFDKVGLK